MKQFALAAVTLGLASGTAYAGGLDRSYTPIDVIFERGNYAELSFGMSFPELTGNDFLGVPYANVAGDFNMAGAALKLDFGEGFSFGLIFDQPYGADVLYGGAPAATLLGGTLAKADTNAMTALLKYQLNDGVSIYGGPRVVQAEGNIALSGLAYGPLSGYNVNFASDNALGWVAGAAYERPDIALRVTGTYHSAVDLRMNTIENIPIAAGGLGVPIPTGPTSVELPQSFELAAQSGVAANTLVFGSVRWSEWSAFSLDPNSPVPNLAQLDDTITYEIGVGRKFTDQFSGSFAVSYEPGGDDKLVSPLAPTDGQTAITLGGKYQINDMVSLSGGVRYTWLGNALPETGTPDTARGLFKDNNAVSAGLKLGVHF